MTGKHRVGAREMSGAFRQLSGLELENFWGATHTFHDNLERYADTVIRPGTKLILTSAYSSETVTRSLDGQQIRGFIRKPFQLEDLVRLLRDTLASAASA